MSNINYNDEYDKLHNERTSLMKERSELELSIQKYNQEYHNKINTAEYYDNNLDDLYNTDTSYMSPDEENLHEETIYQYEQKRDDASNEANDIYYNKIPQQNNALNKVNNLINENTSNTQELTKAEARETVSESTVAQSKNEQQENNSQSGGQSNSNTNTAKNATNSAATDDSGTNSTLNTAQPANDGFEKYQDTSQNFKLPDWNYLGYAQELNLFRKGLTGLTAEPGWFYFKIIFHFDENHGLLGHIVSQINKDKDHIGNTAIQFLESRQNIFKQDNLKARAVALRKFVKYLSYINSVCPWYFDKITGLDNIVPQLNDFSKDKSISIGCMVDAVDLRLTSLMHLYQYACYDEIYMKEIIPENLRKFNMSIVIYHMPLKQYSTIINGGEIAAKSLQDNGNFSNRMSYKLYTFKGCEFDLETMGSSVPNSLDNAQPFNLGQNSITIKYDRAFTHLMNEWEQFMVGADGFYYNVNHGSGDEPNIGDNSQAFYNRISRLIDDNTNGSRIALDGLLTKGALTIANQGQMLGNIYDVDTMMVKTNMSYERNRRGIYLQNIFGNVDYYKGLMLARNVPSGRMIRFNGNNITSMGLSKLPNSNTLNTLFRTGQAYRLYYLSNSILSKYYISEFDLYRDNLFSKYRSLYSQFYITPFQTNVANIVSQYKYAWENLKGAFKYNVYAIKNIGKNIARSWGF